MNFNCDYTSTTSYNFYQNCCKSDDVVNIQGLCTTTQIQNMLQFGATDKWTQFFIPEIVDIPSQKPDVESVDTIYSSVEIISQRVIKTPVLANPALTNWEGTLLTGRKLVIEGLLKQKIVYTAARSDQPLHSAHFIKPFSVFIIIDGDTLLSQVFKIETCLEDIYSCRLSERNIFKNTTIFIKATPLC